MVLTTRRLNPGHAAGILWWKGKVSSGGGLTKVMVHHGELSPPRLRLRTTPLLLRTPLGILRRRRQLVRVVLRVVLRIVLQVRGAVSRSARTPVRRYDDAIPLCLFCCLKGAELRCLWLRFFSGYLLQNSTSPLQILSI